MAVNDKTPQSGELAADFTLVDATGAERRLSELTATRPLLLMFYRGHW